MPARTIPLVTDQVYHVFNKTQGNEPLFVSSVLAKLVRDTLWYYQFARTPMKLSHFLRLSIQDRDSLKTSLPASGQLMSILSYCFMPNHYHLLLKQKQDGGISTY